MNLYVSLLRYSNILYNIQIFKMTAIATTVLQETTRRLGWCGASSELRPYIKSVRDCQVRVLITNNALAERRKNSKFFVLS